MKRRARFWRIKSLFKWFLSNKGIVNINKCVMWNKMSILTAVLWFYQFSRIDMILSREFIVSMRAPKYLTHSYILDMSTYLFGDQGYKPSGQREEQDVSDTGRR